MPRLHFDVIDASDVPLTWLLFWIAALACYRVTVLITRCLGPWGVFKKLRSLDRCSTLLTCPYCVSVYIGGLTAIGLYLYGVRLSESDHPYKVIPWVMLSLAFSAVTIALDKIFSADHNP